MDQLQKYTKMYLEFCLIATIAVIVFSIATALGITLLHLEEQQTKEITKQQNPEAA